MSELFQDMSILVSQQGDQIDNIESNIIHSLSHVDKANVELKKADKYQSNKRFKSLYCGCFIIFTLLIIIIIIIIVLVN